MKHPRSKQESERRCAVTGCTAASGLLLAFAASPSGKVVVDWKENLPVDKRVYLLAHASVLREAVEKQVFSALGEGVAADADVTGQVERQWKQRIFTLLSLCKRSGAMVMGFEKCKAALTSARAAALVQASDGAEDGRMKLAKLAFHHGVFLWERLEKDALSQITGLANQTHIVLYFNGLTEKFIEEARNFERFIEK